EVAKNQFQGKLWATARYIHNWPDTPDNRAFNERYLNRWARYPNYSAETSYSAIYACKAAIEKTGSLATAELI
ncbi:MAG: hypothetical protein JSW56_01825, partial [Deltaproteobacteria bacterium]